jgi:DNA-3-methyladenine glycosylase II
MSVLLGEAPWIGCPRRDKGRRMSRKAVARLSPRFVAQAERDLSARCRVLAGLIARHGACALPEARGTLFETLARSIIGQQLSAKAARAIHARLLVLAPSLTPEAVLALGEAPMRAAGLSGAKARWLQALAARVADGSLDFGALNDRSDEEAIETLIALPGVGRWTAEMFLIFGLRRTDVLSLGDAGLQRAAKRLYGVDLERAAEPWRPYRSVASWHLWRHLDDG